MKVTTKNEKILGHKTEALILGLFEKQKITGDLKSIDDAINNEISFMIKNKEFKGEFKEAKLISTHRKLPANKILLVGLGKEKDFTSEKLRRLSAVTAKALRNTGIKSFSTTLHSTNVKGLNTREKAQIVTEGIVLGLYDFKKYITVDKEKIKKIDSVVLLEQEKK